MEEKGINLTTLSCQGLWTTPHFRDRYLLSKLTRTSEVIDASNLFFGDTLLGFEACFYKNWQLCKFIKFS
jgi:hypothetical protein